MPVRFDAGLRGSLGAMLMQAGSASGAVLGVLMDACDSVAELAMQHGNALYVVAILLAAHLARCSTGRSFACRVWA